MASSDNIRVAFYSTYKLERLKAMAQVLESRQVDLNVVPLSSRKPGYLFSQIWKQPRDVILMTHDWLLIPFLMRLVHLLKGNRYVLISNSLLMEARRHNRWSKWRLFLYERILKSVIKNSEAIVCNSQFLRALSQADFPKQAAKFFAIYNGIEIPQQNIVEPFAFPDGINFVTITNFEYPYKYAGVALILEALRSAGLHHANLFILGKAPQERGNRNIEVFKQAVLERYPIRANIIPNANVFSYLQPEKAIFVYSSGPGGDSLPRAILEAQGMGMPSVIVDTNGCAEAVIPGQSALVTDATCEALAEGLRQILSSQIDRRQMGEIAKQNIREKFSWEAMAGQYASLFASIAPRR
jgi:glycosyltransferase involved in cell wall biosynthesis